MERETCAHLGGRAKPHAVEGDLVFQERLLENSENAMVKGSHVK